jgi:hypothetical protein
VRNATSPRRAIRAPSWERASRTAFIDRGSITPGPSVFSCHGIRRLAAPRETLERRSGLQAGPSGSGGGGTRNHPPSHWEHRT